MSKYYPNRWVILKFTTPKQVFYKVFAGWYGGFTKGDSWQLNSGIAKVVPQDDCSYDIHGYSGSIYNVHPVNEQMSMYMQSVFQDLCLAWDTQDGLQVEIVEFNPQEDYSVKIKETTD